ncbi:protein kinase domain-containing protein [Roseibacillus persicicus]|nr:serine/threonine-protein kinase [Roseibacillus persicicus]
MKEKCRSCGRELTRGESGFCPSCLFGTAIAQLAEQDEELAPAWEVMEDYLTDYEFHGELGRGGTGVVYEATERKSGEPVAVKVLAPSLAKNPEFVERFRREAKVMSELKHPSVVTVRTWGEQNGLLFLVMEYLPSGSLAELLQRVKRLSLEEAVSLLLPVCDGLDHSHQRGILHRDIKPGNLLLDTRGQLKVADFGLAKILGRESEAGLTVTNATMGTPRYMAPEQMAEGGVVDARTDVYALGVVLYEMLTGKTPGGNFALPSELLPVGEKVDEVILKAMSDQASDRFRSIELFGNALESLVHKPFSRIKASVLTAASVTLLGLVGWFMGGAENRGELEGGATWAFQVEADGSLPEGYPNKIEHVRAMALSDADREFGVALLSDGSLQGFGSNQYGQSEVPSGRGFVAVAVGRGSRAAHGLALTQEGKVVAWGDNSFGQVEIPEELEVATSVAAGEFCSAALSEGEWIVWGRRDGDIEPSQSVESDELRGRLVVARKLDD